MQYKINKGLRLPITGDPRQAIDGTPHISRVAVLGREVHPVVALGVRGGQVGKWRRGRQTRIA